jgi:hypothetical protein
MQHADFVASGDGHRSRGNGGNIGNDGGIGDSNVSIGTIGNISNDGDSIDVGDISTVGSVSESRSSISIDSIDSIGGIMMSCDIRSSDSSGVVCDRSGVDDARRLVSKSVDKRLYAQCHSVSSLPIITSVKLVSSKLVSSVKLPSGLGVSDVSLYVSLYLSHLDLASLSVLTEIQVDMIEATHRSLL